MNFHENKCQADICISYILTSLKQISTSLKIIYTAVFTEYHLSIIKFDNFDDVGLIFEICIEKTFDFNVINTHFSKMFVFFTIFICSHNLS